MDLLTLASILAYIGSKWICLNSPVFSLTLNLNAYTGLHEDITAFLINLLSVNCTCSWPFVTLSVTHVYINKMNMCFTMRLATLSDDIILNTFTRSKGENLMLYF